ncbi:Maf family protein [Anaerostipes hadrus]|uniref:Maf family protein n=1 Tax=Anaerostipes hadrus TaxID=649756 RepID=UPI0032C02C14
MKHIILASASPRRKEILELADLKFDVMPSDAQEITTKTAPNEVVIELASIKAKDIYKKSEKQSMIVGADTVVAYQGQILGKPTDKADAKRMLTMLSGQTHEVYTGVCVIEDGKTKTFYEETKVTFYEISDEQINHYIKTGEPMDKAGSYGIQGKAAVFIKGIEGDYYNVVGFPIARFLQEITK